MTPVGANGPSPLPSESEPSGHLFLGNLLSSSSIFGVGFFAFHSKNRQYITPWCTSPFVMEKAIAPYAPYPSKGV